MQVAHVIRNVFRWGQPFFSAKQATEIERIVKTDGRSGFLNARAAGNQQIFRDCKFSPEYIGPHALTETPLEEPAQVCRIKSDICGQITQG